MDPDVAVALISIVPGVFWVLLVASIVAVFYKPIRYELLPRIQDLNIFGVETTFVRERMDRAIEERSAEVDEEDRAHVVRRVCRLAGIFHGATILWADTDPTKTVEERAMLRFAGISLEVSRAHDEALTLFKQGGHDVMIVTVPPGEGAAAVLELVAEAARQAPGRPIILYVDPEYDPEDTPSGVFDVADRPDELLHSIADALERERS